MKYMLLIFGNEAAQQAATKEQTGQTMAAYGAYSQALAPAGVVERALRRDRGTTRQ